jgi:hypothetical protein
MVFVIFRYMFPPRKSNLPNGCFTEVPRLARYWIDQMTVSGYNTGLVKELQVQTPIFEVTQLKVFRWLSRHHHFICVQLNVSSGRGVLIDYASYAAKKGITYTTFSTHQIHLTDILEIAKESNLTFHRGDILFVRIGVTNEWDNIMTDAQKREYSKARSPEHAGVEATTDMLRWLWDCGFSAVAGDAISWEVSLIYDTPKAINLSTLTLPAQVYPPQQPDIFLHECLLAGWGMPIGKEDIPCVT